MWFPGWLFFYFFLPACCLPTAAPFLPPAAPPANFPAIFPVTSSSLGMRGTTILLYASRTSKLFRFSVLMMISFPCSNDSHQETSLNINGHNSPKTIVAPVFNTKKKMNTSTSETTLLHSGFMPNATTYFTDYQL